MSSPDEPIPSDATRSHSRALEQPTPLGSRESKSAEERINSLLLLWQEQQGHGRDLSAAELCRDCPELESQLGEQIHILRQMNALLGSPAGSPGETVDHARPATAGPALSEVQDGQAEETGAYLPVDPQQTVDDAPTRDGAAPAKEQTPRQTSQVPGYETVKELGRGGMGVVYLARLTRLGSAGGPQDDPGRALPDRGGSGGPAAVPQPCSSSRWSSARAAACTNSWPPGSFLGHKAAKQLGSVS